MAVSHNSVAHDSVVGALSISVTAAVAAGTNLAAAITIAYQTNLAGNVQSLTFGGAVPTFIQLVQGFAVVEQYYIVGVVPGSRTLNVVWDSTITAGVVGVEVMNDVDQTMPLGASKVASGNSAAPTVTLTGTISGSFVVDGVNVSTSTVTSVTPDATQTQRWNLIVGSPPDRITGGCSTELSGGGSVPMSWALGSARNWVIGAAEFLAAAIPDTGKPISGSTSYHYGADPLPLESFKDPAVQQRIWVNDRRYMQGDI